MSPIPVVSVLDEFAKDKMAAAKKYGGKTFPFSGTFTQAMTQSNDTPGWHREAGDERVEEQFDNHRGILNVRSNRA